MIGICVLLGTVATHNGQRIQPDVALKPGMAITRSIRVRKGQYMLPNSDDDGKVSAITIRGDNITVDFNGATVRGTPETVQPNERKGTAIIVKGKGVTIKNLRVRGYRNGIVAIDCPRITIADSDFSYNYKPKLLSTLEREDGADWMSFHKNENDEWLREKAPAIYLRRSTGFEIRGNKCVGGQTALMLVESDHGTVWNNNFSFLSAVGLAMYRSSDNRIMHNKMDWCVRGFSFGVYNRGQDSSGIIVYEQSSRNVFAYNSATHGGDGFFLWAGQTTMDTGKGGSNDNLLYGNDFSHSPANGIEATFSRNTFVNNLLLEDWHGIWGGFSWSSKTVGNIFGYNDQGIAWEHGQNDLVASNIFFRNNEDIAIWANPTIDPNWGYGKARDTKSRDWRIVGNWFTNTFSGVFRVARSENVRIENNTIANVGKVLNLGDFMRGLSFTNNEGSVPASEPILAGNRFAIDPKYKPLPQASSLNQGEFRGVADYLARFESTRWNAMRDPRGLRRVPPPLDADEKRLAACEPYYVQPLEGGIDPFLPKGALRGWRYILVDEWGPYDFRRPVLWPRGKVENGLQTFEVLGPKGTATVLGASGLSIEETSGDGYRWTTPAEPAVKINVPSFVRLRYSQGDRMERSIDLDYVGGDVVDHRGVFTPRGKPYRFGFSQVFIPIDWNVRFYEWDRARVASPRDKMPPPGDILSLTQLGKPNHQMRTNQLEFATGGSPAPGVPADGFITLADGIVDLPPGDYTLNVTADDGVRVWVDGKQVLDEWHWQGPTPYSREVRLGGRRRIRVEHYEIDGYTALKVEIRPRGR